MSHDKKQPFVTSMDVVFKLHVERRFNQAFRDFDDLLEAYEDGNVSPLFYDEQEMEPYDIVISRMYDRVRDLRNAMIELFDEAPEVDLD